MIVKLLLFINTIQAQTTYTISGRVTDPSGMPVPFASVALKGKASGITSDDQGHYLFKTSLSGDSVLVSSLGYQSRAYPLQPFRNQVIDVVLIPSSQRLQEVKVYGKGGDPAYRIMREVIRHRDEHNPVQLTAYEYESYTKIEAYLNNVESGRKNRKGAPRIGPVGRLLARLPTITDEAGRPAVPIFISEQLSSYYHRSSPEKAKELVRKTQVKAVGVTDGGLISQFTGTSFQQYNFYRNYLNVLQKDIPSPIADVWQGVYTYRLIDTVKVGESVCYQIDYQPKRSFDLAFAGTIWIDTTSHALVQVAAQIDKRANINFIDEIRIEQELEPTSAGAWLPVRTQVMIDTDELLPRAPGGLVRFYSSARQIVVNEPKEVNFYDPSIELADDYKESSPSYWTSVRPETLTAGELRTFQIVDSVRNVPFMRVVGEGIRLGFNGYQSLGKLHLDYGPFLYSYASNTIEGHRFRVGLRTNPGFSRRWVLRGYAAYGTLDQQVKYSLGADYIVSRKPWTLIGARRTYDLEQVGLTPENLGSNSFFYAYARFGSLRRPFFQEDNQAYLRRELGKGFTQTVTFRNRTFEPLYAFAYRTSPTQGFDSPLKRKFRTTEVILETRLAPDEVILQNDNERLSLGATRKPVYTFRYIIGLRNVLDGAFNYHRFSFDVKHSFRLGALGRTYYNASVGYIPSILPYPLLHTPLGNESWFYVDNAYNLMNFFEFVCDRYVSIRVEHNFEGLFFNRIPAIRRLKWRFLTTAKVLVGGVSPDNLSAIPATDDLGQPVAGFQPLGRTPYVEVGYGIDNIFKVMRVDAIHRLTYRDNPGVTPFTIKASFWVSL
ncbi:DUF5686 and carboxypeptidase-like regulatory domain-containing protein [Nibrella saemangeumensis]|uniref:DUF5686 and carboxypeptidase-like regulatory domain-containing protein n=1 Tax=Nibrella saemangeumensis TaxID=1084526 RepID=A0ABP8NQT7_9BACT